MSVVVYKNGLMAADSRAYSGNSHPIGDKKKIHQLSDGTLVGICSNQVGMPEAFLDWLEKGGNRNEMMPSDPGFDALVVKPNGDVFLYCDGYTPSGPLLAEFYAIGSGRKYAYGAMMVGADPVRAVKAAMECDIWTGGAVHRLHLNARS